MLLIDITESTCKNKSKDKNSNIITWTLIFESKHFIMAKLGKIFLFLIFPICIPPSSLMTKYKRGFIQNCTINKPKHFKVPLTWTLLFFAKQSTVVFASQFSGQISYSYQEGLSFVPKYEQLHHVTCYNKSRTESCRINQGTVQT